MTNEDYLEEGRQFFEILAPVINHTDQPLILKATNPPCRAHTLAENTVLQVSLPPCCHVLSLTLVAIMDAEKSHLSLCTLQNTLPGQGRITVSRCLPCSQTLSRLNPSSLRSMKLHHSPKHKVKQNPAFIFLTEM